MKKLETPIVPLAYTASKAAAAVDVGPDYFKEHIAPHLETVRRGDKTLYPVAGITRWLVEEAEPSMSKQVR